METNNVEEKMNLKDCINEIIYNFKFGDKKDSVFAVFLGILLILMILGMIALNIALFPVFSLIDKNWRNLKKWSIGTLIWLCTTVPVVYFVIL